MSSLLNDGVTIITRIVLGIMFIDLNRCQQIAISEWIWIDCRNTTWNINRSQSIAIIKCRTLNRGYTIRYRDRCYAAQSTKSTTANFNNAVRNDCSSSCLQQLISSSLYQSIAVITRIISTIARINAD